MIAESERGGAQGTDADRTPWATAALLGLSTMVIGGSAPVYDSYVPKLIAPLIDQWYLRGAVMGVDNITALLAVPFFGAWSDRVTTRFGRRVPFVVTAMPLLAIGCIGLPFAADRGIIAMLTMIVIFSTASAAMRAPMQALLVDLVASRHRSRVNGLLGVMMCLGAMPMLGLSSKLYEKDPHLPFVLVGSLIAAVSIVYFFTLREPLREPPAKGESAPAATEGRGALAALRDLFRHPDPMLVRFVAGSLFFHMGFQAFSSLFTSYGTDRYGVPVNKCSIGFMFVGGATLLGAMPAGFAGTRYGRKVCALFGVLGMLVACSAMTFVTELSHGYPFLALFGASWSFAFVNLLPMMLELGGTQRAATLSGVYLVCASIGAIVGPALCGLVFDVAGSTAPFFGVLAVFLGCAAYFIGSLRAGFGEATA